jgi:serine/threonine-protein kinase
MTDEARLQDLLSLYEQRLRQGEAPAALDLCADCPELATLLEQQIVALRKTERLALSRTAPTALSPAAPEIPPPAPEPPPETPRYRFLSFIAQGGMGEVWRGHDRVLNRKVAIKVLRRRLGSAEAAQCFRDEAALVAHLEHPSVVPVHDSGELADGRPFFVMKLVGGRTLSELLRERPGAPEVWPHYVQLFGQVCQAVAFAHAHSPPILHRDLKPSNVMVGDFGEVQVMDWGLAKLLAETSPPQPVAAESADSRASPDAETRAPGATVAQSGHGPETETGVAKGTPQFMAPEQARGVRAALGPQTDVFGLGGILCVILTGQPPHPDGNLGKVAAGGLVETFTRLEGCTADGELIALAKSCLAPDPSQRPADAGAVARAVLAYQAGVQERLRKAEVERAAAAVEARAERKRRRLQLSLIGAVLALMLLGGGAWFYLAQERAQQERRTLARQAETARQVQDIVGRIDALRQQARADNDPARWAEARALADRAQRLVTDLPEGHELTHRVAALGRELAAEERDRRLVERLEEIWLGRAEVEAQAPGFGLRWALREYPPVFAENGLRVGDKEATAAAWVRRRRPETRARLLVGLDTWLGLARQLKAPEVSWLFGLLQAADDDVWRKELRAALTRDDPEEVERLARSEALTRQPPQTVLLLADYFRPRSQGRAVELLRAAQARFPADFWVNFALADTLYQKHFTALSEPAQFEDAVRFFTTARALRPNNLQVKVLQGWSLWLRGRHAEGRMVVQQVIEGRPNYFGAYLYLGAMHLLEGAQEQAEAALKQALKLQPRSGLAHCAMGFVLWGQGRHEEALLSLRRSSRLEPIPRNFLGLAGLLGLRARLDEAVAVCRQALQVQPDFSEAKLFLRVLSLVEARRTEEAVALCRGLLLLRPNVPELHVFHRNCLCAQGRFAEALPVARRALELARKTPTFPVGLLTLFVRETEQWQALDPHLPAYITAERKVHGGQELALLVNLCWVKQQYLGATQLYAHAFAAEPPLAEDVSAERRLDAARYAARAAAGQGDAARLTEKERARWRKQALDWLQADLAGWRKLVEGGSGDDRALAQERLRWWQEDPKLAGLREPHRLAVLPEGERRAWQALWADVDALLRKLRPRQ